MWYQGSTSVSQIGLLSQLLLEIRLNRMGGKRRYLSLLRFNSNIGWSPYLDSPMSRFLTFLSSSIKEGISESNLHPVPLICFLNAPACQTRLENVRKYRKCLKMLGIENGENVTKNASIISSYQHHQPVSGDQHLPASGAYLMINRKGIERNWKGTWGNYRAHSSVFLTAVLYFRHCTYFIVFLSFDSCGHCPKLKSVDWQNAKGKNSKLN